MGKIKVGIVSILLLLLLASVMFSFNLQIEVKEDSLTLTLCEIKANTNLVKILGTNPGYNHTDIHWPNQSIPVSYSVNSSASSWITTINQSFMTWQDINSSYISYQYAGGITVITTPPEPPYKYDGANVISIGPYDGPGNVLACAAIWNTSSGIIVETDILFDSSESWSVAESCPANAYDVQNCMTHEVGHTLMLWDLYDLTDSEQTMYGYTTFGETKKRTLNTGDMAGASYIYPCTAPPDEPIYDVAITNLTLSKTELVQGEPLQLNVTVKNQGDFPENLTATLYANDTIIETWENIPLESEASLTLPFQWNTTSNTTAGLYSIAGYLALVENETNIANNNCSAIAEIIPSVHDVAIVDILISSHAVVQNCTTLINVTVQNKGNVDETFNVDLYANDTWIGTAVASDLHSNMNMTFCFVWNTTGCPIGKYVLRACIDPLINETNTIDNTLTENGIWVLGCEQSSSGGGMMPLNC